jgi:chromosome segregation ATPase
MSTCGNSLLRQAGFQPFRQKFLCQVKESNCEISLGTRNGGITVDKAKDEAINKLITGQDKMGNDITELKSDVSELKAGVSELKHGQQRLESDVSELKLGQSQTDGLILKVLDNMARLEGIVVRMENDLNPKVKTLFDADKVRHYDTTELKQVCREQDKKLGDHELRITRLEK